MPSVSNTTLNGPEKYTGPLWAEITHKEECKDATHHRPIRQTLLCSTSLFHWNSPLILRQLILCSTCMNKYAHGNIQNYGDPCGPEKGTSLGKDGLKTLRGLRAGYSFCPRLYRQAQQPISTRYQPYHPSSLDASPLCSALPWSSELGMVKAGTLKQSYSHAHQARLSTSPLDLHESVNLHISG